MQIFHNRDRLTAINASVRELYIIFFTFYFEKVFKSELSQRGAFTFQYKFFMQGNCFAVYYDH